MHTIRLIAPAVLLFALLLLVTACGSAPKPLLPVVVEHPKPQPLPPEARQPKRPDFCLPTCQDGWTRLVNNLPTSPSAASSPVKPASASATR